MVVASEHDSAFTRGRILAHDVKEVKDMAAVMVKSKLRVSKHRRQLVLCNAPALLLATRCFISFSADMLQRLLIQHLFVTSAMLVVDFL
jgi:hypothetical protein